jgi:hypothetical protein
LFGVGGGVMRRPAAIVIRVEPDGVVDVRFVCATLEDERRLHRWVLRAWARDEIGPLVAAAVASALDRLDRERAA